MIKSEILARWQFKQISLRLICILSSEIISISCIRLSDLIIYTMIFTLELLFAYDH